MNAGATLAAIPQAERHIRNDFPGVRDWHYLDTAATAQKPQVVLDAMMRAGASTPGGASA